MTDFAIRPAVEADVPVILELIRGLAEYERAPEQVVCDEGILRESLFGVKPDAEVLLACVGAVAAGFAVFFHNYSTWWGRRGMYLEDLFVRPEMRGRRVMLFTLVAFLCLAIATIGVDLMHFTSHGVARPNPPSGGAP